MEPSLIIFASAGAILILLFLLLMRPRRFYLIRHGETILNAAHIRQGEDGGLSENGRHQAELAGQALKQLPIKRIISSSYQRARETTEILNKYLHAPVIYTPLLGERRNPTEIIGKSINDPNVMHIDDFRISDEENFLDLKKRARKCLSMLAHVGSRATVVVTHHHFLKILIAYLLYRESLHAPDFVKLSFFNYSDNASITICEYHPWKRFSPTHGWTVIAFNTHPEK
jgi:broad specificity phosphatase PhoE